MMFSSSAEIRVMVGIHNSYKVAIALVSVVAVGSWVLGKDVQVEWMR